MGCWLRPSVAIGLIFNIPSMAYPVGGAWHASCDSSAADRRPLWLRSTSASGRYSLMLTRLTQELTAPFSRRRWLAAAAGLALGAAGFGPAMAADDTIKIGVLHSLSGTMAISETTLKDTILFLIDEQNKKGGVLGKKLEAVVVDPEIGRASCRER